MLTGTPTYFSRGVVSFVPGEMITVPVYLAYIRLIVRKSASMTAVGPGLGVPASCDPVSF
jgi:hypothetical protein